MFCTSIRLKSWVLLDKISRLLRFIALSENTCNLLLGFFSNFQKSHFLFCEKTLMETQLVTSEIFFFRTPPPSITDPTPTEDIHPGIEWLFMGPCHWIQPTKALQPYANKVRKQSHFWQQSHYQEIMNQTCSPQSGLWDGLARARSRPVLAFKQALVAALKHFASFDARPG